MEMEQKIYVLHLSSFRHLCNTSQLRNLYGINQMKTWKHNKLANSKYWKCHLLEIFKVRIIIFIEIDNFSFSNILSLYFKTGFFLYFNLGSSISVWNEWLLKGGETEWFIISLERDLLYSKWICPVFSYRYIYFV